VGMHVALTEPAKEPATAWLHLSNSGRAEQQGPASATWLLRSPGGCACLNRAALPLVTSGLPVLRADRSLHDVCQFVCVDALAYIAHRAFAEERSDAVV
jgi:hypothetical protein